MTSTTLQLGDDPDLQPAITCVSSVASKSKLVVLVLSRGSVENEFVLVNGSDIITPNKIRTINVNGRATALTEIEFVLKTRCDSTLLYQGVIVKTFAISSQQWHIIAIVVSVVCIIAIFFVAMRNATIAS